jgi:GGDEF domain-containing protein
VIVASRARARMDPLVLPARVPRCSSAEPQAQGITVRAAAAPPRGAIAIHDERAPDSVLGESTNLRLVRLRLFLALLTMFAIPIAIAAPVIYGLGWGFGASLVVPTAMLLTLSVALGTVTVWLARRVLEPAQRLEETRRILEDAYDRARSESLRDALTGLGNHRGFQEEVERQWAMATRHALPLALAIIDLDDFKQLNDTRGHAAGDRLLRQAAATIATYLRRSDRAFRIGGDEFAIVMPGTDAGSAPSPASPATASRCTRRLMPPCSGASAMAGPA